MIWIGTSGFQYPEWKGTFYPEKMPVGKMLNYYASRFPTTEINYTFRQLPSDKTISNWIAQTPVQFRFTMKALRQITEYQRLRNCEALVRSFVAATLKLGGKRGALLFQLPPHFECDTSVLDDFLNQLPNSIAAAFEFRHKSWFSDSVFDVLRKHNASLCIAESEKLVTPTVFTGRSGYFRLRRVHYTDVELRRWAEVIRENTERLDDVYVYFKHEEAGTGPKLANALRELLGLRNPSSTDQQDLSFG